jgi:hypothetical protein
MLSSPEIHDLSVRLFRQESERDKQRKIGASQISEPCTYHLARSLTTFGDTPTKYWLGGKIGTATHMFLEDSIAKADLSQFPELEDCRVEQKIYLGELEGYGTINSKPDLVLVKQNHLIDWKTSTRDKSRKLQRVIDNPEAKDSGSIYTLKKYTAQAQLYAWGLNRMGVKIDGISLVFINRDGTTEGDIWDYTIEYSEEFALAVWQRLENVWNQICANAGLDSFEKDADCFKCNMGI